MYRRRWAKRGQKRISARWLVLLAFLLLPAWLAALLRPRLATYAENYVQYQATRIMEQAVADCAADLGEIGSLHQDTSGAITALTTSAASINRVRTRLVQQVYDDIGSLEQARSSVALGTLLDPQLLGGLGPQVPFGIVSLGRVTAETDSEFSASGINQTLYEVRVTLRADFSLQLLGMTKTIAVQAEYPLEETVIVGDVPLVSTDAK